METSTKSVQNASPQDVRFRVTFEAGDPANPQNFAPIYKTWLVLQMSLLALAGALGSSIISSAETEIGPYIAVGPEVTSLAVALYVLGWALGPMIWAPTSELFGRRIGMLPAMLVMACFTLGTAGSTTAAGIFMTRFMGGIFASAPISNVPAALGDLYRPDARGIAMTLVSICISGGPTLGPLIGAAIVSNEKLGWRWTMYIQAIFVFCLVALCFFCLPETYAPALLKAKAKQLRKTTGEQRYWHPHEKEKIELNNILTKYLSRPLRMLLIEPLVTCLALYASFTYSLIYLTLEVFPIVFREHRQWAPIPSTLPFLGILVGTICAAPINLANQPAYKRAMAKNSGKGVPEARLPPLIVGGVLLNAGLFWFGWTAAPKYMWLLPTVAGVFLGAGFTVVLQQCLNFLVDAYGPYAASAVSANTILRSILACAMPIAARPMFINMGVAPATSLLGGISCLALPAPFLFMRYTTFLRRRSRFATA